jgi:hypothetical protein
MHQRRIGWTCLRRCPRQTPTNRPDPRRRTCGTHLRRPRSPACSLRQLKVHNERNRQTSIDKKSHKFK